MKASGVRQAIAAHLIGLDVAIWRQVGATARLREGLYLDEENGGFVDGHLAFALEVVRVQADERQRHHHLRNVSMILQVGYIIRSNNVDQVGDRDAALDLGEFLERSFEELVAGTIAVETNAIDMLGDTMGTHIVQLSLIARPEDP